MIQDEQLEHDLICDTGTAISRMKIEVEKLNEMIESYQTYTSNDFFVTNLKNLKQRMLIEITTVNRIFNNYVDYNESLKQ